MVSDDSCFPSIQFIQAKKHGDRSIYGPIYRSKKYCDSYIYSVEADSNKTQVTLLFELFNYQASHISLIPAVLTILLEDCPIGLYFNSNRSKCTCSDLLKSKGIKCEASTRSLEVPPLTWIGKINGREAIQTYCQYCQIDKVMSIQTLDDTDKLCRSLYRTGVLCGACISNFSLQLGGYKCSDCSKSTYKGILLLIGFAVTGFVMVILLLRFNLTVSTGFINGLIFYSNIVYLNSDTLLPLQGDSDRTHLDNVIIILSTFKAWMNLDFGIVTCFFHGYDTYLSTWMQFVYPLYIWLIIVTIVLASRYSSRISKLTTSNTVSVLATLLLLSYAKLLKTSIEVASFTEAEFLNDSSKQRLWLLDGNIEYLDRKHLPLFLMSLTMTLAYLIPFTLLISLGPILQARSHYKFLKWINKLKPFLDAFYGPYTIKYRYWPGLLLLARLSVFSTHAFFSLGDGSFRLMTVSVMVAVLLATWIVIGRTNETSLHRKRLLNYLEVFLHLNLGIFAAASIYTTQFTVHNVKKQQALATIMVGSVLLIFCGVAVYQIFCIAGKYKSMRIIASFIHGKLQRKAENNSSTDSSSQSGNTTSTGITHTMVEMTLRNNELRERLLTN